MQLDTTHFPLVYLREHDAQDPASSAEGQLEALLDQGLRFVLLTDHLPGDHPEESHDTGDRAVPAALRLAVQGMGKALGMRMAFVQENSDAQACAQEWLADA